MRIVVLVKQVPEAEAISGFDSQNRLIRGEDDVLNELDEHAIEAAVSLREELDEQETAAWGALAHGPHEVIALTMGPVDAEDAVRRALQMDCDAGYHVEDERASGSDVIGTARVLATAINRIAAEHGRVDLVVCGMSALDSMTGLLPGALAAQLHWPLLSQAQKIWVENDSNPRLHILRVADGAQAQWSGAFPLVVSVSDQCNEPRYPNFRAIQAAKAKPITTWDLTDLQLENDGAIGFSGAAVRVNQNSESPARALGRVHSDTGDGAEVLADFLQSYLPKGE